MFDDSLTGRAPVGEYARCKVCKAPSRTYRCIDEATNTWLGFCGREHADLITKERNV
jgi:hypothetical protein